MIEDKRIMLFGIGGIVILLMGIFLIPTTFWVGLVNPSAVEPSSDAELFGMSASYSIQGQDWDSNLMDVSHSGVLQSAYLEGDSVELMNLYMNISVMVDNTVDFSLEGSEEHIGDDFTLYVKMTLPKITVVEDGVTLGVFNTSDITYMNEVPLVHNRWSRENVPINGDTVEFYGRMFGNSLCFFRYISDAGNFEDLHRIAYANVIGNDSAVLDSERVYSFIYEIGFDADIRGWTEPDIFGLGSKECESKLYNYDLLTLTTTPQVENTSLSMYRLSVWDAEITTINNYRFTTMTVVGVVCLGIVGFMFRKKVRIGGRKRRRL